MKILQITPQVPWPPEDGGKVGIFNITKHLAARGHEVALFALDRSPEKNYEPLRGYCALTTLPHSNTNTPGGALLNIFSDLPYNISKYRSAKFLDLLVNFTRDQPVDVVHVDHLHMAEYGLAIRKRSGIPVVLREHNVESVIMERFAEHAANPLMRSYARLQKRRLKVYESKMTGLFDACCPITPHDGARILEMNPGARVRIVPGGVDESYFEPPESPVVKPESIVFFGAMDWIPNRDALAWFLEKVLPLIIRQRPAATLTIVGKNVPEELSRHAVPGCIFRGYVEDLRSEIQKHAVSIAPFRIGGGMRLKIIESFAMRVPVVSTSIGCEGIAAIDGEHLLVGDTPAEFASAVLDLLDHPAKRLALSERAFALAQSRYRWDQVAAQLEEVYREVISDRGKKRG